jgi:hypothetical protein
MSDNPAAFFAKDYFEARAMFLDAAKNAGARMSSVQHPTAKGPGGRDIFMDCAVLGDQTAPAALVVISGTHGPEGYCGSGVQVGLLREGLAQVWAKSMRVILIHAHNAYGFAWDTRFNEDNIDLNRNYLERFDGPLPQNPDYDLLAPWAAPATRDEQTLQDAQRNLFAFANERGFPALQAALTGGQYNHPKGVYYGGNAPSWSHQTLVNFFKQTCDNIEKLVTIDMHTGLGPFGHGEVLSEAAPGTPHFIRQTEIWGDEVRSTKDGSSVSADLYGTMDSALERVFADIWSASIAIEFGTIEPMNVFLATQASSWLHCYGDPEEPDSEAIRSASRAAFYPETDEWKSMVWTRSHDVIGRAAAYLRA